MVSLKTTSFQALHNLVLSAEEANITYVVDPEPNDTFDLNVRYSKILNGNYIVPTNPQAELWLMSQSNEHLTVHDGPIPS